MKEVIIIPKMDFNELNVCINAALKIVDEILYSRIDYGYGCSEIERYLERAAKVLQEEENDA